MKKNKGITLVALIITIIVMMILVGVSVSMVINSDLLGTAKGAGTKFRSNMDYEESMGTGQVQIGNDTMSNYISSINGGNGGQGGNTEVENPGETPDPEDPDDTDGELPTYEEAEFNGELLAENATFTTVTAEGDLTAVVPAGFKVINGRDGTQSVEKGLVIQDANGNEFVWIPVVYDPAGDADDSIKKLDTAFLAELKRSTTSSTYPEPYGQGYTTPTTEADDYYDMMKSVQNNFGFYIGRYEAGIDPATNVARTDKENRTTTPVVVKRDCYPYNYVGWGESMSVYNTEVTYSSKKQGDSAVLLSKNLINSQTTGATSTLCYGVQWDAMLNFVEDTNHSTSNSTEWGNYRDNQIDIDRQTARYTSSPSSDAEWNLISETADKKYPKSNTESILLTTGASDEFEAKNIYDVAGNVREWTMEAGSSGNRVVRGGYYTSSGSNYPASNRNSNNNPSYCLYYIGFRPTLYITNE